MAGKFRTHRSLFSNIRTKIPRDFAADREVYIICDDHSAQLPSHSMGMTLQISVIPTEEGSLRIFNFMILKLQTMETRFLIAVTLDIIWIFNLVMCWKKLTNHITQGLNPNGYDNAFYQFDYNGSSPRNIEVGYFGTAILNTPFDLGVTDAHFFRDLTGNITPAEDKNIWPVTICDQIVQI